MPRLLKGRDGWVIHQPIGRGFNRYLSPEGWSRYAYYWPTEKEALDELSQAPPCQTQLTDAEKAYDDWLTG